MNIFQIEERLKQEPSSPLSVRLAGLYVARGRIDEAMQLCICTLESHPKYATAYTILGRCYAANKQFEAAIYCIEKSLSLLPDAELPQRLLNHWKENLESEQITQPSATKETMEIQKPIEINVQDQDKQTFESPRQEPDYSEAERSAPRTEETEKSQINDTNNQTLLTTNVTEFEPNYRELSLPVTPTEIKDVPTIVELETKNDLSTEDNGPPIISITLADIYAKQGGYKEAIKIYNALIQKRPKERHIFESKIKELEEKSKTG
jgi:tetratricopeptide (TPR) repeat protein